MVAHLSHQSDQWIARHIDTVSIAIYPRSTDSHAIGLHIQSFLDL